jgi:hypothetical protein
MMDIIRRLQSWYFKESVVASESAELVLIGTLDNPGWIVKISVAGTVLEPYMTDWFRTERTEEDWIEYRILNSKFEGHGGAKNFREILGAFFRLLDSGSDSTQEVSPESSQDGSGNEVLQQLEDWYAGECNGDWEHTYGITIRTTGDSGWLVVVDLNDLNEPELEQLLLAPVEVRRSKQDWLSYEVKDENLNYTFGRKFIGRGGSGNLEEILQVFIDLAKKYGGPHENA